MYPFLHHLSFKKVVQGYLFILISDIYPLFILFLLLFVLLLLFLLLFLFRGDRLQRSWWLLRRLRIHENVVYGQKPALAGRPGLPGRLDVGGGTCLGWSKWEISLVLVANSCSAKKPEQDEEEGRQEERGPPASQPGPSGNWKGEKEFSLEGGCGEYPPGGGP